MFMAKSFCELLRHMAYNFNGFSRFIATPFTYENASFIEIIGIFDLKMPKNRQIN